MTHTPTPWRITPASEKFIADAGGVIVAQAMVHALTPYDHAVENAARIVKCVNSYDDLVAALKEAIVVVRGEGWDVSDLEAALVKAGAA